VLSIIADKQHHDSGLRYYLWT